MIYCASALCLALQGSVCIPLINNNETEVAFLRPRSEHVHRFIALHKVKQIDLFFICSRRSGLCTFIRDGVTFWTLKQE